MSWTKLGDEFGDVTASLSDAATRTHIDALNYSNRLLLDLVIPKKALIRFANSESRDAAAYELVATGWWEDRGHEWFIGCRFPEWQLDKADVEHRQAKDRDRQHRRRQHMRGDHSACLPSQCRDAMSQSDSRLESLGVSRRDSQGVSGTGRDGTGRDGSETLPTRPGEPPRGDPRTGPDWLMPGEMRSPPATPDEYVNGAAKVRAAIQPRPSSELAAHAGQPR